MTKNELSLPKTEFNLTKARTAALGRPNVKRNQVALRQAASASAALQKRVEEQKARIDVCIGVDKTNSTNDVANAFIRMVNQVVEAIQAEFQNAHFTFGAMQGTSTPSLGGKEILNVENRQGDSRVDLFSASAVDEMSERENKTIIVIGDEVCLDTEYLSQKALRKLIESNIPLFFIYKNTEYGGQSFSGVKSHFIDPLGENGFLIDMSEANPQDIVEVLKGCVSFRVNSSVQGEPMSVGDLMKKLQKVSQLRIAQGRQLKIGMTDG